MASAAVEEPVKAIVMEPMPAAAAEKVTRSGGGGGGGASRKNRIQVSSSKKPLFFYVNLAKRYMQQHNEIELSALGMAIGTVVTVAEILKNNGLATEKKILTSTVGSKDEAKGRIVQKAKIEILLEKSENFDDLIAAPKAGQSEAADHVHDDEEKVKENEKKKKKKKEKDGDNQVVKSSDPEEDRKGDEQQHA